MPFPLQMQRNQAGYTCITKTLPIPSSKSEIQQISVSPLMINLNLKGSQARCCLFVSEFTPSILRTKKRLCAAINRKHEYLLCNFLFAPRCSRATLDLVTTASFTGDVIPFLSSIPVFFGLFIETVFQNAAVVRRAEMVSGTSNLAQRSAAPVGGCQNGKHVK